MPFAAQALWMRLCTLLVSWSLTCIAAPASAAWPDGQHDFDFNFGTWHTHITRTLDPFTGGIKQITLDGTVTVRKLWDGRGQLEEIEADGPNGHWEGLTVFLYNPTSHQWSQNYAGASDGVVQTGPLIGQRVGDRIELFSQDTFDGRFVLARGVWSEIRPDSHRFEISYSDNGGASWKVAFSAYLTRQA